MQAGEKLSFREWGRGKGTSKRPEHLRPLTSHRKVEGEVGATWGAGLLTRDPITQVRPVPVSAIPECTPVGISANQKEVTTRSVSQMTPVTAPPMPPTAGNLPTCPFYVSIFNVLYFSSLSLPETFLLVAFQTNPKHEEPVSAVFSGALSGFSWEVTLSPARGSGPGQTVRKAGILRAPHQAASGAAAEVCQEGDHSPVSRLSVDSRRGDQQT